MKPLIFLENIRSAYNVGNIIRTADALGYDVVLAGYTPSPFSDEKVKKSSLGAEEVVEIHEFWHVQQGVDWVKREGYVVVVSEKVEVVSVSLWERVDGNRLPPNPPHRGGDDYPVAREGGVRKSVCIVVGNEKEGVTQETIEQADRVVHIPMQGVKESLNVGQAAAIMMREISKYWNVERRK